MNTPLALRIAALLVLCPVGMSAQVPVPNVPTASDPADRVMHHINQFRDPSYRSFEISVVGSFAWGYFVGLMQTEGPLADPARECFATWSIGQAGEWLLQYWERSPELWDKHWMSAAGAHILDRLRDPSGC